MRNAPPKGEAANRDLSDTVAENEGHAIVSGLFSCIPKMHLPSQSHNGMGSPELSP